MKYAIKFVLLSLATDKIEMLPCIDMTVKGTPHNPTLTVAGKATNRKGMVLPFQPLSLTFDRVSYYVDMPAVSIYPNYFRL